MKQLIVTKAKKYEVQYGDILEKTNKKDDWTIIVKEKHGSRCHMTGTQSSDTWEDF